MYDLTIQENIIFQSETTYRYEYGTVVNILFHFDRENSILKFQNVNASR